MTTTTAINTYQDRFIIIYRDLFTDSFLVYSGDAAQYGAFADACKTDKLIMLEGVLLNTHYIMRGEILTKENNMLLLHISMQPLGIRQKLRAMYNDGQIHSVDDVRKVVDPKRVTAAEALGEKE